jgi:hypothetical protein
MCDCWNFFLVLKLRDILRDRLSRFLGYFLAWFDRSRQGQDNVADFNFFRGSSDLTLDYSCVSMIPFAFCSICQICALLGRISHSWYYTALGLYQTTKSLMFRCRLLLKIRNLSGTETEVKFDHMATVHVHCSPFCYYLCLTKRALLPPVLFPVLPFAATGYVYP